MVKTSGPELLPCFTRKVLSSAKQDGEILYNQLHNVSICQLFIPSRHEWLDPSIKKVFTLIGDYFLSVFECKNILQILSSLLYMYVYILNVPNPLSD